MKTYRIRLVSDGVMYGIRVDCYDDEDMVAVAEKIAAVHDATLIGWEKV